MRGLNRIFFLLAFAISGTNTSAQNNAYNIYDDCYVLFQRAEAVAGTVSDERFNQINDSLLHMALAKNDRKAQVLYLDTSYTQGGARFVLEVPIVPPERPNS